MECSKNHGFENEGRSRWVDSGFRRRRTSQGKGAVNQKLKMQNEKSFGGEKINGRYSLYFSQKCVWQGKYKCIW
jgi:glutathionyl-hydroquinone reductase